MSTDFFHEISLFSVLVYVKGWSLTLFKLQKSEEVFYKRKPWTKTLERALQKHRATATCLSLRGLPLQPKIMFQEFLFIR